jgi:cytochrome c oxidase subunit 4
MFLCLAYWIAFGPHGPRALPPPGEGWKVASYTAIGLAVAFGIVVALRFAARDPPSTMTKEYQEATNEYLKVCAGYLQSPTIQPTLTLSFPFQSQKVEPISGISSEGYAGKGYVQSPPKRT